MNNITLENKTKKEVYSPRGWGVGGGWGYCHIWAIWACAAEKCMVFKQFTLE